MRLRGVMMRDFFLGLTVLAVTVGVMPAQEVSAADILARVARQDAARKAALEGYSSVRDYKIVYTGTGGARMGEVVVRATYRAQGGKECTVLSQSGSEGLCHKVLDRLMKSEVEASEDPEKFRSMLSPENYDAELVGEDTVDGVKAWVLDVTPKVATKFNYRGKVWVSQADASVIRIQGAPAKMPSMWVDKGSFDSRFERVDGFWLPAKNVSVSHVWLGGEARLTIDYGTYSVNGHGDDAVVELKPTTLAQR
jgi:hypothetical protein